MDAYSFLGASRDDVIADFINNAYIIDFGFITEVVSIDFVNVQIGASNTPNKIKVFPCVLGSHCSSNMTVKVDPKVGDKVIVLYPRAFHVDMFSEEGTVCDKNVTGYSYGGGIAFLANQFFEKNAGKDYLHIKEDAVEFGITGKTVTAKVDPENDTAVLTVSPEGDVSYKIKDKCEFSVTKEGAATYEITGKCTVSISKDGAVTIDSKDNVKLSSKALELKSSGGDITIDAGGNNVAIKGLAVKINDTSLEVS